MRLTEEQLRNIISETIKESLFNNLYRGFSISKDEPTDYKGVFARCGYDIKKESPKDGSLIVYATQKAGAFGGFHGDEPNDVVSALKRLGISAKFLGSPKNAQYIFAFRLMNV